MAYVIDQAHCSCCHRCRVECPAQAIRFKGAKYWIDPEKCVDCGHCVTVCHNGVISNPDLPKAQPVPHEKIVKECDVLVIGGGAAGMMAAVAAAERALVVTTPDMVCARDAQVVGHLLFARDLPARLIINRLRPEMIARGDMMSVEDVLEILAVDLIGAILDDEQIVISTNQGEPLSGKNSQAEEEYRNICRRLMGEEVPYVTVRRKNGVFHRLGSIFRK